MYFKQSLLLIRRNDLSNMKEYLVYEINVITKNAFLHVSIGPQVKFMRS